ncbi:f420-dependent NADP reductase [Mytilinidion resinicola]|uniref:F420-dependent NADP reductase n=1 Tax=Mytilinidion resinicola TaxID=574789 RepID=A0A6A6Z1Z2_9PEZI|nr:f420-dependent NADP reductase [Mytilinidion resinicola]KAF2815121.1 f420-dependent NADP reductase [Mytilinidion resinicola]
MKIAIAGAGDLARYSVEEFLNDRHEVVVLSRSQKPRFQRENVTFRITDYSVPSLTKAIDDCEGLLSAILDYSMASATVHLALLEACRNSAKCKRFIPSEYAGNTDEHPNQPVFYYANHEPVRKALREQKEVMWTLFNPGWLTDYLISPDLRYIKDIGEFHPVRLAEKALVIPGTGDELITFTPARDVAKGVSKLFNHGSWEDIIYVCGQTTTWNAVGEILRNRDVPLKISHRSVNELEKQISDAESEDKIIAAQYDIWSTSGAGFLPQEKLKRQAAKYFRGVKFRTVEEFLDDAEKLKGCPNIAV